MTTNFTASGRVYSYSQALRLYDKAFQKHVAEKATAKGFQYSSLAEYMRVEHQAHEHTHENKQPLFFGKAYLTPTGWHNDQPVEAREVVFTTLAYKVQSSLSMPSDVEPPTVFLIDNIVPKLHVTDRDEREDFFEGVHVRDRFRKAGYWLVLASEYGTELHINRHVKLFKTLKEFQAFATDKEATTPCNKYGDNIRPTMKKAEVKDQAAVCKCDNYGPNDCPIHNDPSYW